MGRAQWEIYNLGSQLHLLLLSTFGYHTSPPLKCFIYASIWFCKIQNSSKIWFLLLFLFIIFDHLTNIFLCEWSSNESMMLKVSNSVFYTILIQCWSWNMLIREQLRWWQFSHNNTSQKYKQRHLNKTKWRLSSLNQN